MVLPSGTGPGIIPIPSPNMYGRGVSVSLMHVVTTSSVSSIPPVDIIVSLLESPKILQSPTPRHLLCGMYPTSENF